MTNLIIKTPKGTELKLLSLHGKMYLPVAERIQWFREDHPDWTIVTTPVEMEPQHSIFKATISDDKGRIIATAHKSETMEGFADHMEKAETGSIGRALSICGYGTLQSMDLDEGHRLADAPKEPHKAPPKLEEFKTPDGKIDFKIPFGKEKGKMFSEVGREAVKSAMQWAQHTDHKKFEGFISNCEKFLGQERDREDDLPF